MSDIEKVGCGVAASMELLPQDDVSTASLYTMLGREVVEEINSDNPELTAIVSSLATVEQHLNTAQAHLAAGDTHLIDYLHQLGFEVVPGVSASTAAAFAGKNILPADIYGRFNYAVVHETFERLLDTLPADCTLEDFKQLCDEAEAVTSRALGSHNGMSMHLFRYFGTEMLPRIFPDIQRYTFSLEASGDEMTIANGDDTLQKLPTEIHGVNTEELIGIAGMVVQPMLRRNTHVVAADGNCSTQSWQSMKETLKYHPHLADHIQGVQFETSSRREAAGDRPRTGLIPVAAGHTLYGIRYKNGEDTDMILCIDPTVAQVDRTEAYDIEATAIKTSDLATYMRLRYRTYPDIPVGSTINPAQYTDHYGE